MKSLFSYALLLLSFLTAKAQCTTLIVSKYIEGSGNNKALELANVGDKSLELLNFEVRIFTNGSTTPSRSYQLPEKQLNSSAVYTIVHPSATLFTAYDTTYAFNFNGNDAIQLIFLPTGDTIDVIGKVGEDPGEGWEVDTVDHATLDHTLIRKSIVNTGSTNWGSGKETWLVKDKDDVSDFGNHSVEELKTCEVIVEEPKCEKLIFSEYIEGSSQNKALEITNVSNGNINLSRFKIEQFSNGGLTPTRTVNLPNQLLLAGNSYTLAQPNAAVVDTSIVDTLISFNFNGNDALVLLNNVTGDTVDIIGQYGVNPGDGWSVSDVLLGTLNHTLIRKPTINQGSSNWEVVKTQWQVYEEDYALDFGKHTVDVLNSCLITSLESELLDSKQLKAVYDLQGKALQDLQDNTFLILHYDDGSFEKVYFVR